MADELADFDALWNYGDPAATRAAFLELEEPAREAGDRDYLLQLGTQIARTFSLQRSFEEAHARLDQVEQALGEERSVVTVRYWLERGRAFNSAGEKETASGLFEQAWDLAREIDEQGFAVDAAHMLGISVPGDAGLEWNRRAIRYAEASQDEAARRWLGALHNNTGWSEFEAGRHEVALEHFEAGLAARIERGQEKPTLIARWSVARALRSLERVDEALAMQRELREAWQARGEEDGFVYEELGECLLALGQADEAARWFAQAHPLLAAMGWIEAERLERIAQLGGLSEAASVGEPEQRRDP